MNSSIKRLTPLRAIRKKCIDCTAGSRSEIRYCLIENCPLFHFRFGRNPRRQGIGGRKAGIINEKVD